MRPYAEALGVAEEAALAAGGLIRAALERRPTGQDARHKGAVDLVTEVDLACEEVIREILARRTPDIAVLAEEGGGASTAATRWIVDPLDGTTNFVHGFREVAVLIALQQDGEIIVSCTYDPIRREIYRATLGGGAWCGETRLHVSKVDDFSEALLLTGFAKDRRERAAYYLGIVQAFMERAQGIRRAGAAGLDFAHIASGRAEGFWEFGLSPWDVAAGSLLVREAGGRVTDMGGGPLDVDHPRVLASNGRIHDAMAAVLDGLVSWGSTPPGG